MWFGEEQGQGACGQEELSVSRGLEGVGERLPGELEVLFCLGEFLCAQGQVLGEVEGDQRAAAEGDGVGAEVVPLGGGDAGFLAEFPAGAVLGVLAVLLASAR